MRVIRLIPASLIFICVFSTCIEPFTPDVKEGDEFIVIHGTVTDQEGYQYAEISRTSAYSNPEYLPLNDCQVSLKDDQGNEFAMELYDAGRYRTWMEQEYLQAGTQYKLEVVLDNGNGKRYESEYDTLLPCPEIDSIYYEYQEIVPDDPQGVTEGAIQLYLDFDATGDYASNFRWEAEETWEYHSEYLLWAIYYGIADTLDEYWLDIYFPDPVREYDLIHSLYTCYKTQDVKELFTYTTHQKSNTKVIGLPLYLVINRQNRLVLKYSILIKQYTLSDVAYEYWSHLQSQSQESGGLYDTQPYELKGNIRCIDDENEPVIGIFSASSVKTRRFSSKFHMRRASDYCADMIEGWNNVLTYLWGGEPGVPPLPGAELPDTPLYLQVFYHGSDIRKDTFAVVDQSCFDCTLKGGTLTKPDYW